MITNLMNEVVYLLICMPEDSYTGCVSRRGRGRDWPSCRTHILSEDFILAICYVSIADICQTLI